MPLPVIDRVIRVVVEGTGANGTPWANILHYQRDAAVAQALAITSSQALISDFYESGGAGTAIAGWAGFAVNDARVSRMTHTPLDGVSASTFFDVAIVGEGTTDPLPPDSAIVITWRTANRGRRYRGRTYWAGLSEALNDTNGRVLEASRLQMVENAGQFITTMATNQTPLVVASYTFSTAQLILSANIDNVFDRQKRRAR